jgi:anthranilate synthase/aminodeoxychorismate synthase-like glutamine amidotransferase
MIFVIDNYDSFTYNLVQLLALHDDVQVKRNDKITVEEIERRKPSHVVISPGPGRPEHAGITIDAIKKLGPEIPLLGVCLGHQAIGYAYGCSITRAVSLMHGKTSMVKHNDTGTYAGLENPFVATRYHSLVIDRNTLGPELTITSETEDGVIMGVKHNEYPIEGIQFHPESILTTEGPKLISNWLNFYK